MEEEVFTPGSKMRIAPISQLKREVVEMRRAVNPLAGALATLIEQPVDVIPKEVRRYFRDVHDHHTQVTERVNEFNEALSSLIDAAMAKVSMQQNSDMRKISSWVAIAAVPTMIAGIYGMNFDHMPELHWTYGYGLILLLMASVCIGLFVTFRHNDWL